MAHFALLNENNIVVAVHVVNNEDCGGGNFPDSEPIGQQYLTSLGLDGQSYRQTSYSGSFRGVYAGINYSYDPVKDEFIAPPSPDIQTIDN